MSTHTATDNPYRFNPSSGTSNVLNRALRDNWWLIALRGLLGVIFGVVALLFPGATILSLVLLFSAYMLVDGLFATVAAVRAARERARWGYLLLQGIASIATAVIAFLWPALTVVAFILLIAAWSIVSGCLMLSAAFRIDERHGRWWLAFGGILVDRRLFTRIRRGAHYPRLQAATGAKRVSGRPCRRSGVMRAGKPQPTNRSRGARRPSGDTTTQLATDDGKSAWLSPPNRVCLSQPRRARASHVAGPWPGRPPTRASSIRSTRAWKKAFRRAIRRVGPRSPELVRRNEAGRRRGFTLSILRVAAFTNDPLRAHHGRRTGDAANSAGDAANSGCELTVANISYPCHDALASTAALRGRPRLSGRAPA